MRPRLAVGHVLEFQAGLRGPSFPQVICVLIRFPDMPELLMGRRWDYPVDLPVPLRSAVVDLPVPLRSPHAPAAPEGEVLAVTVTISDKAKPKDRLAINVANWNGTQYATDWIEYDIAFAPGIKGRHPYFSTLEGNNSKPFGPLFKIGTGVDQFGRDQITGPGVADGKSVWEHRIIGLSSTAPGPLGKHGIVFTGGKAGTFTVYLDNLRIRHLDGSTTPLWTSGKDTKTAKFTPNQFFTNLEIRTVKVEEVAR